MSAPSDVLAVPCGRYTSEPPSVQTTTTREQQAVEERCLKLFLAHLDAGGDAVRRHTVPFDREKHIAYLLKGLEELPSGFQALDASRPWLCYWILNALDILGHTLSDDLASRCERARVGKPSGASPSLTLKRAHDRRQGSHVPRRARRTVAFLKRCEDPSGGYCGGPYPGQLPHLAPTYAAINSLMIIGTEEAYRSIDRQRLYSFLRQRKDDALGCFTMHEDGEVDVR